MHAWWLEGDNNAAITVAGMEPKERKARELSLKDHVHDESHENQSRDPLDRIRRTYTPLGTTVAAVSLRRQLSGSKNNAEGNL